MEEVDSGSKCEVGHPIWLVAEGYGLCVTVTPDIRTIWYPWRFSPPRTNKEAWGLFGIKGRNGESAEAWTGKAFYSKKEALDEIQADMAAHRALPFDEEAERARLVAV